jgi:hypothetical protein
MKTAKKVERIFLRLTIEEKQKIFQEARKRRITTSEYIRYRCLI